MKASEHLQSATPPLPRFTPANLTVARRAGRRAASGFKAPLRAAQGAAPWRWRRTAAAAASEWAWARADLRRPQPVKATASLRAQQTIELLGLGYGAARPLVVPVSERSPSEGKERAAKAPAASSGLFEHVQRCRGKGVALLYQFRLLCASGRNGHLAAGSFSPSPARAGGRDTCVPARGAGGSWATAVRRAVTARSAGQGAAPLLGAGATAGAAVAGWGCSSASPPGKRLHQSN